MKRVVGFGPSGVYRRFWDYAQHRSSRRYLPSTVTNVARLQLPHAQRFAHLQKSYRRDWDYAAHWQTRRRMPVTITEAVVSVQQHQQAYSKRFPHIIHDTYTRPWDYSIQRPGFGLMPITITTTPGACDDLIELNHVLANDELVLSAADTTQGGHGAGGYITDPSCYVRKY